MHHFDMAVHFNHKILKWQYTSIMKERKDKRGITFLKQLFTNVPSTIVNTKVHVTTRNMCT